MAIDPDVQELIDGINTRLDALESVPPTDLTQIQADIAALQIANSGTQAALAALDTRISALEASTSVFELLDALSFTNRPDLGIRKIKVLYQNWYSFPNGTTELPDLDAAAERATTIVDPFACHDLELWYDQPYQADWYKQVSAAVKSGYAGPTGHYGVLPIREYWTPQKPVTDPAWDDWRARNDALLSLVGSVDMLFPSLYTFYDDQDGWEVYARANVAEARRLAPGMPCFAFLWPQYHQSNATLGGSLIPADYWRRQLDVVHEIADGAVLWGGWLNGQRLEWDDTSPWWVETQDFMAGL